MLALSSVRSQEAESFPPLPPPGIGQAEAVPQSSRTADLQSLASPSDETDDRTQAPLTFTGCIEQSNGASVLVDRVANLTYQLDDQIRTKSLRGRRVRVVGKLQLRTNTILVDGIALLP